MFHWPALTQSFPSWHFAVLDLQLQIHIKVKFYFDTYAVRDEAWFPVFALLCWTWEAVHEFYIGLRKSRQKLIKYKNNFVIFFPVLLRSVIVQTEIRNVNRLANPLPHVKEKDLNSNSVISVMASQHPKMPREHRVVCAPVPKKPSPAINIFKTATVPLVLSVHCTSWCART